MGQILNSKIYGNGRPLIVLHGLFGLLDNWNTLAGMWAAQGMEVHLLDMRGHGRSFHSQRMDLEDMAGDVIEYMRANGLGRTSVLGHSMGGKAAMLLACRYQQAVTKLIVADIAPKAYPVHHAHIIEALTQTEKAAPASRSAADEIMSGYIPDPTVRGFLLKSLYRREDGTYAFRFDIKSIGENLPALGQALPYNCSYEGPALFIRGALSRYILPEDFSGIKAHFPQASLATIEGAGHWLHAEKKDEFFDLTTQFLLGS